MSTLPRPIKPLFCAAMFAVSLSACGGNDDADLLNPGPAWPPQPAVTGHRGASALRPEHTLASYQKAIDDGVLNPDGSVVMHRPGIPPAPRPAYGDTPQQMADRLRRLAEMGEGV